MKKVFLTVLIMAFFSGGVFADTVDNLDGITPAQKQKLSMVQFNYKQDYNNLEQKILEYNSKLLKLQQEKDKSPAEISMLSSAYERNLKTLKAQQEKLNQDRDERYKMILTEEQYKQYKEQNIQTENAYIIFLQK